MNKFVKASLAALVLVCAALIVPSSLWAQAPEVSAAVNHDVSPPLRSIPPRMMPRLEPNDRHAHPLPLGPAGLMQPDPVLQTTAGPLVGTTSLLNFAGVG